MPARRYCCVVDCKNSEQNSPRLTFYRFPGRNYQIEQKNRWIQAVRRTCDGKTPWQPNKNTRICSSHFIGGKKSENMYSPSYIPTIFPPIYHNKSVSSTTAIANNERFLKRIDQNVNYENVETDIAPVFVNSNLSGVSKPLLQVLKKPEEAQGGPHDIEEQETSGPSFNIKEEIYIAESVLEDYLIPKLEIFENTTSVDTTNDVDPLSFSCMEIQTSEDTLSRSSPKKATVVSSNIGDKSHNINENSIIPKLESCENTREDIVRVEENFIFVRMQNQPVQETTILLSTLKDNTNFSHSSSNTSLNKKRKFSDQDSRVEDHDFLNIVHVKSENREDYVDYAMYIVARLKNSNQSANAIAIAKEKIELILYDLDKGLFENLIAVTFKQKCKIINSKDIEPAQAD